MVYKSAIVVGAGIAGLAMARALAIKEYQVHVIEKEERAVGASIRNFGMVWPIGQPERYYDTAMKSRSIWLELGQKNVFWYRKTGSIHLAYADDEWQVLQEVFGAYRLQRNLTLMKAEQALASSASVVSDKLCGALHSADELIVDPREAIRATASYLSEQTAVKFYFGKQVKEVRSHSVQFADGKKLKADLVVVCSGSDHLIFEEEFRDPEITKCKLQMMRMASERPVDIGAALCGGLSLIHYKSFRVSPTLSSLRERFERTMSEYMSEGIHVMVSQNGRGEITVGDSHEYGATFDPFDDEHINKLILQYLVSFFKVNSFKLIQSWNGVYTKLKDDRIQLFKEVDPGVFIFNGLGGNGMTMSFGLAEENVDLIH